jgi:hypothetical protein
MPDYLPTKQSDKIAWLYNFAQQYAAFTATGQPLVGIKTVVAPADVSDAVTDLDSDFNDVSNAVTASKAATQTLANELTAAITTVRQAVAAIRGIPDLDSSVLATLGLPVLDKMPTPIAAPTVAPVLGLTSVAPGVANLTFKIEGAANPRARLKGSVGVQVSVADSAAAGGAQTADAGAKMSVSRSPFQLDTAGFPAAVRIYARWITQRGLTGPWSNAVAFVKT